MNYFLLMLYVALSTSGATLVKYGGSQRTGAHLSVPVINTSVSYISILGLVIYGASFILFVVLLNKLNMSYLVPVATGVSYILLMIASSVVFGETFTVLKVAGCALILAGVLMVLLASKS